MFVARQVAARLGVPHLEYLARRVSGIWLADNARGSSHDCLASEQDHTALHCDRNIRLIGKLNPVKIMSFSKRFFSIRNSIWIGAARGQVQNLNSFVGQFSLSLGTNLAVTLASMVTGLLAARLLGPQGRGELAAVQSWVLLLGALATLGMAEAVVYFVGRTPSKAGRFIITAQALNILPGIAFILIGWLLMPLLLRAQAPEIIDAARLFLVMMVPIFLTFQWYEVLRSVNAWRAWSIVRILPNLVWIIILVVAFRFPALASPVVLILIFPIIFLFQVIPSVIIVIRSASRPFGFDSTLALPLAKFGVPTMLTVLPSALNLNLDQLLMAMFLSPTVLGLYVASVAWASAPAPAINAFGQVLFPRLSAIHSFPEQITLLTRVLTFTAVAVIVLYTLLFLLTPVVFPFLFGTAYAPAVPAALVLVIANSFRAINLAQSNALYGLGRPRSALIAQIVGVGVTVVGLLLLLPRLGIMGAAIASLLAYFVICCVLSVDIWRASRGGKSAGLMELEPGAQPVSID